jgi:putative DNA primase/helicase
MDDVGYCLHHWGLPFPRSLLLIGPTAGGKSTFLNVVNRALGEENVSNQSLQGLVNDRFGKAAIFGKMANIDNDLSSKAVAEEGTFKKLTAGDRLMIEEKNQQPFDIRVTQKQIYSANRVPKVTNPDDAFFRRWIHVQFPDTVPESERDRHLEHRLTTEEELSGVLNWMLEGYARLMDQDSFTGERSIDEKRSLWKAHGDSLDRFIESEVIKDSAAQSAKDAVYAEYKQFCDTQGFPVKKKQTLSKRLKQAIDIETSKPSVDGEQVPHYRGMRLKNNAGLFE